MAETLGQLNLELTANSAQFVSAFRSAAEASGKARNDITLNLRAIRLASAELNAQLATGTISHVQEIAARRNIISLAQQSVEAAKREGIERGRNLGYLQSSTRELERQKAALEGIGKGRLTGFARQFLDAIKLRAAGIPGMGSLGGALAIRAYEPAGKFLEESAGKLEEKFGGAALAVGGLAAGLVGLGAVAVGVTHHMMALAQSVENEAVATGLSTREVQELREAARETDVDAGSLEMAFSRLNVELGEYVATGSAAGSSSDYLARTLKQFGVQMLEVPGVARPVNDVLEDFSEALQKIPDAATRSMIASRAFGTRGRVIAELFQQATREGETYAQMLERIGKHGPVLSDSDLNNLMEMKSAWDKATNSMEGFFERLGIHIADPTIKAFMKSQQAFARLFAAAKTAAGTEHIPALGIKTGFTFDLPRPELPKNLLPALPKNFEKSYKDLLRNFANPTLLGSLAEENEKLQQRLTELKAGGEFQARLAAAEKNRAAAVSALQFGQAIGNRTLIAQKKSEIGLYSDEEKLLRTILAKSTDLPKLQAQYAAAEQDYTVAAIEGQKFVMAQRARQLAQLGAEIEAMQKLKGAAESAAFATLKISAAKLGPRAIARPTEIPFPVTGKTSGLEPPEFFRDAGKTLEQIGRLPGDEEADAARQNALRSLATPDISGLTRGFSVEIFLKAMSEAKKVNEAWLESTGQTVPLVEEKYSEQLENFRLMMEQGKLSAQDFAQVQVELQQMALREIKDAYSQEVKAFGTASQRMKQMLEDLADSAKNFSGKMFDSMERAIDGMEDSLARLVITGRGSFRQVFEAMAEEATKNAIQLGVGKLAAAIAAHGHTTGNPKVPAGGVEAAIGKIFGVGDKAPSPKGTRADPLYVIVAAGAAAGGIAGAGPAASLPSLPKTLADIFFKPKSGGGGSDDGALAGLGIDTSLPKLPKPAGESGAASAMKAGASIFSAILKHSDSDSGGILSSLPKMFSGSGFGSLAGSFLKSLKFFGGFLAEGGDVTPGRAYVVGENHPELFLPRTAGRVIPAIPGNKGGGNTSISINVHGARDADSFRRSSSQIYAHLHAQAASAAAKNR